MLNSYDTEDGLIEAFLNTIVYEHDPLNIDGFSREFDYRSGRTDIIFRTTNGRLISVEAKLSKWKNALHQAYRCSAFSHYSYVLLPLHYAHIAVRSKDEFEKRNVGLLTIENNQVKILIKPKVLKPLQPWLTESAYLQTAGGVLKDHAELAGVC